MIRHLEHNQINFDKWDHCINNAINGIIYPFSFYLNQVSPKWEALVLNDYEAVMPLPVKKKYGFNYIIQPVFVQQLGIFSSAPVNEQLMLEFIRAIPGKYIYININFNTYNPIKGNWPGAAGKGVSYELDLISPYALLKNKFSTQTKKNLKMAGRSGVFVAKHSDPMPIISTFRQYKGKNLKVLDDPQYETLRHLIYSGIYRGNTEIYSAYTDTNTFCAGIVFFTSHRKSILIFSGSTPEARNNGAMSAIINHFISEHAGQNLTLDFEGSMEKNLARFYGGFGSKECVFLQLEIIQLPVVLKPLAKVMIWLRKKLQ
jgi:hypothetical protein